MLESLLGPYADAGLLILRVGLGIVFLAHGLPKLNSSSPIGGIAGFSGFLKQLNVPLPTVFAWLVALLETVGAALLILGLGTRILGLLFAIDMLAAILSAKIGMMKAKFSGQGGWEFEFALLVGALALVFTGAGAYSLDAMLGSGL